MASITERSGKWAVRWREAGKGGSVARQVSLPSRDAAERLAAAVEHDVALHGSYLGYTRPKKKKGLPWRPRGEGLVYFAEAAGRIKIGFARDIRERIQALQIGCPVTLTLIASTTGDSKLENRWHVAFQAHRLHGEWFTVTGDLLDRIERECTVVCDLSYLRNRLSTPDMEGVRTVVGS